MAQRIDRLPARVSLPSTFKADIFFFTDLILYGSPKCVLKQLPKHQDTHLRFSEEEIWLNDYK